jgi:hypothetical protein
VPAPDRISIIINTWNRADGLATALDALDHLDPSPFEVVVVNGPSTDHTEDVLARWSERIKVGTCPDRNLARSRNVGLALASGDLVAFMDDDAYPDPAWLDHLRRGFGDEVAAVGGPTFDYTGHRLQSHHQVCTRLGDATISHEPEPLIEHTLSSPTSFTFPYPIGTNACFRRDLLVAVGGFDEHFAYFLEETDATLRLVDQGWIVRPLECGHIHHKSLPSGVRAEDRVLRDRYLVLRSKVFFSLKHGPSAASFATICKSNLDFVAGHRRDIDHWIEHGALTHADLARFELDVDRAFDDAFSEMQTGRRGERDPAWFDQDTRAFLPFEPRRSRADRLHICLLSQEYPPGPVNGIARVVHTLATSLAADGHVVRVVTEGQGEPTVDFEEGVWVHRVPSRPHEQPPRWQLPQHAWDRAATALDELRRIDAIRPIDVVQSPSWDSEGAAVIEDGRFPHIQALYTPVAAVERLDPALVGADPSLPGLLAGEAACLERSPFVLINGETALAEAARAYGVVVPEERRTVIPHTLPDLPIPPTEEPESAFRVGFVGRLERRKGIDTLLAAVPAVLAQHPDVRFTVMGDDTIEDRDGTYRARFEASASPAARAAVEFTGRIDDAERERRLADCNVVVVPSRFESFGLVVVEAMRAQRAVIAADIPPVRTILDDGRYGLLADPDDPTAWAKAILELAGDASRRHELASAGRARYLQSYTPAAVRDASVALYRRAAARRES